MEIKIVIADDHPMFRSGVRMAIESDTELTIAGEASDGKEALQVILTQQPDVAILDVSMSFLTGLQVAKELKDRGSSVGLLFLTMFDDEAIFNEAIDLDVKAYILKESAALDMITAIHMVYEGRNFISPSLFSRLVTKKKVVILKGLESLTEKEILVLRRIAEYKSSKEIAGELNLSPRTIDNCRSRISEKLSLNGSYSLLKFAVQNKNLF